MTRMECRRELHQGSDAVGDRSGVDRGHRHGGHGGVEVAAMAVDGDHSGGPRVDLERVIQRVGCTPTGLASAVIQWPRFDDGLGW
jgi:hypothetical protein